MPLMTEGKPVGVLITLLMIESLKHAVGFPKRAKHFTPKVNTRFVAERYVLWSPNLTTRKHFRSAHDFVQRYSTLVAYSSGTGSRIPESKTQLIVVR